jgi:hypothetical protein
MDKGSAMGQQLSRVAVRGGMLLVCGAAGAGLLWRLARPGVTRLVEAVRTAGLGGLADERFSTLLTAACSVALTVCALWLLAVSTLVMFEALAGTAADVLSLLCPDRTRRLLLAWCGAAMATGLTAAPALADSPDIAQPLGTGYGIRLGGLDLPDRAPGRPERTVTGAVTVVRGDSLWSISEDHLGPDTDAARLTAAWQAIYRANQRHVGPDPDLILPGTFLQIPSLDPPDRKESP